MKSFKKKAIILVLASIQIARGIEYDINIPALSVSARDLALGGMVCSLEEEPARLLECTYLLPFMLKELSIRSCRFHIKSLGLGWTIGGSQSGNSDWLESMGRVQLEKD